MSILKTKREKGSAALPADESRAARPRLTEIPLGAILPNPNQPRREFDEEKIAELARSIEQVGLIQPLIVRRSGDFFELIAGERRLRALKQLGAHSARCIIDDRDDGDDPAFMAIIENLQREDLHYFEEAECYFALIERLGLTQEQLAERIGKSQSFIANKLRLLKLGPELRKTLASSGLSERHARALVRLPDDGLRQKAAKTAFSRGLSVKETEKLVDKMLSESKERSALRTKPRMIRIFRDYRVFINTINSACDLLRESGLAVEVGQTELNNGVDITIRVTQ